MTHTHIVSRISLNEGSVRRRHLYLTNHHKHKGQTSISQAGFEPAIPNNRAVVDPRVRLYGHRDLWCDIHWSNVLTGHKQPKHSSNR